VTELQKRCQELLPVIQAGAEGKKLERLYLDKWKDLGEIACFNFMARDTYRIKPEPQYRPYTPEEALKQGGREIVRKTNRWKTPFYVGTDRIVVPDFLCTTSHSFSDLLEKFVFSDDGSPCGVRID